MFVNIITTSYTFDSIVDEERVQEIIEKAKLEVAEIANHYASGIVSLTNIPYYIYKKFEELIKDYLMGKTNFRFQQFSITVVHHYT